MSLGEVGQFMTGIAALVAAIVSIRNGQRIEQVHKATNSMKDELVAATAKASEAQGLATGLAQGRKEIQ